MAYNKSNFSNANGITFGTQSSSNGNVITASYNSTQFAGTGFSGTNISGTVNSNGLQLSVAAGGGGADGYNILAAGTQTANTTGTVAFVNGNGITFGMSNSSQITASYNSTQFQSTGNYLTTARASNDGIGLNTALTANGVSMTANSSGLSLNFPAFLTTAQPVGAYLTTARASNDGVGLNTAQTNVTWTVNSSGISFNAGAYLTTAALSNHSHNFATTTTNGASIIVATTNSNGATIAVPAFLTTAQPVGAYLTTARASNDAIGLNTAQSNVTWTANSSGLSIDARGYAGTNTAMTGGSVTLNSSGISINLPAYLTTAMASNAGSNFVGLNSAVTGASLTVNSSGISINVPAAAPSPVYVQAGTTNGSLGTISFANSNGVSFGLDGSTITASAAGGGGGGIAISASNSAFTSGTVSFNQSGALTIGTGAQAINFSVPATSSLSATGAVSISVNGSTISIGAPTQTTQPVAISGSNGSFAYSTLTMGNLNGMSFYTSNGSMVGSYTVPTAPTVLTKEGYAPYADIPMVVVQQGNGTLQFNPDYMPNAQFDRVVFPMAMSNATNSSGSQTLSFWAGIYTKNASTLSLLYSASQTTAVTQSGTAGSYSLMSGMRLFTIPMTQTVTEGQYWLAFLSRTTSGGANASYSNFGVSQINSNFVGHFGSSHNTTYQLTLGRGVYTATTNAMPASVAFTQIRGSDSAGLRPAAMMFASSTI